MPGAKKLTMTRREFVRSTAATGAGIMFAINPLMAGAGENKAKKRYAIVGVGSRSGMYQEAIQSKYQMDNELVGFCDTNEGRLSVAQAWAERETGKKIPLYVASDFDRMVAETHPDVVIVTSVDGTHHKYIIRGMELGCDVLTEKPMTTNAEKCRQIIATQKKTGRSCRVAFNYRYTPPRSQVKKLLMEDAIGDVLSVDFHWMLNTHHGADYFRRWHSVKEMSGGLMVHKATHHFDLVNWWLSAIPVSVYASGKREFYTPEMAKRFGLESYHKRCHTCPEKDKCGFMFSLANDNKLKRLYLDNEKYDGYFRDQCVFRPEIDIEDTMNVIVKYDNNITMSYSLNAFNAWEGYYIIFNGTKGRIEHKIEEKMYINGTDTVQGGIKFGGVSTKVYPLRGSVREIEPWAGEGGHGGGDAVMLDDLFLAEPAKDEFLRAADQRSGAYSILTGIAANQSMVTGQPVLIADLVPEIGYPEYPKMPSRSGPLPMPEDV